MTSEVFTQLSEEAHKSLHRHHLHDALDLINMLLKEVHLSEALDDCQQLEDNYERMLQFLSTGGTDENCQALKGQMMEGAMKLLVVAEREYRLQNVPCLYSKTQKNLDELGEDLGTLARRFEQDKPLSKEREATLDLIFHCIWTSAPYTEADLMQLFSLWVEASASETEQCLIVSALSLALQEYVDNAKLDFLISCLDCPSETIQMRAMTGIVLCALKHPDDTQLFEGTTNRLVKDMLSQPDHQETVATLNLAFLICLQTSKAREKMEKDILPNFMKMAKNGQINLGFTEDGELNFDIPLKSEKEKKQLHHTMRDFIDMHKDGIDLNASNMIAIRNLPFFQTLPHWFLPFDKNRTEVRDITGKEKYSVDTLGNMAEIVGQGDCDTDRYGTLMLIEQYMGDEAKSNLAKMLQQHSNEEGAEGIGDIGGIGGLFSVSSNMPHGKEDDKRQLSRKYMQQLYRIFTMSPHHKEWSNPFSFSTNWLQNPLIGTALADNTKALQMLADFLVKYKNFPEAEVYLNQLVRLKGSDAETLRTAAFCQQQQGHFGSALTLYCQADTLVPEHSWTLVQMQLCYGQLEKHEQRLDCLLQLELLEPENEKVISETGLCLMQLKRWQDASQRFFRLELEGKHIIPSQRAIAWCALQQGKNEQAIKYYHKIIESTYARWQDYLNAGHAAWMGGNTSLAIERYRDYIKRYLTDDPKITDALTPFNEDNALLLSLGKQQHEIDLMHDILEMNVC